ncbi:MAG: hypothetical protein JNL36_10655 [Candidatus Kapabacteria bacterium]|nr:hypothetical protein [Candidatus Kapabacteria bacterium]
MNNNLFHRVILQILCVLILFSGNSLLAFQPEPTLFPVPTPRQKYFGLSLSQNFAFRNYFSSIFYNEVTFENDPVTIQPNISFGMFFEMMLNPEDEYSSAIKLKLLYQQSNTTYEKPVGFIKRFTDSVTHTFYNTNSHNFSEYSLQASYVQKLFRTNLSLIFGGTISAVDNEKMRNTYTLNSVQDTAFFNQYFKDFRYSEDYTSIDFNDFSPSYSRARITVHCGLQYELNINDLRVVPFVQYNRELEPSRMAYYVHSIQAGIDVAFRLMR